MDKQQLQQEHLKIQKSDLLLDNELAAAHRYVSVKFAEEQNKELKQQVEILSESNNAAFDRYNELLNRLDIANKALEKINNLSGNPRLSLNWLRNKIFNVSSKALSQTTNTK